MEKSPTKTWAYTTITDEGLLERINTPGTFEHGIAEKHKKELKKKDKQEKITLKNAPKDIVEMAYEITIEIKKLTQQEQ